MAVASSSVNATAILEKIGVLNCFKTVVTAEDVSQGKPHPEIFLTAARRLGLSESVCVVFEDAESGVAAAKRGGFFCIGINRNRQPGFTNQADLVVTDLGEIDFLNLERQFQLNGNS
jgi:beta-phosphoglucomutase-like phosphatase (HAD superfamily)